MVGVGRVLKIGEYSGLEAIDSEDSAGDSGL